MNDAERDAWLSEALRHAPDSGALPPTSLSAAILAEARAAAAQSIPARPRPAAASRSLTGALLAFWDWLARPSVAAGFASVMAATVVGLMWWDRPMDEAMPQPPALDRLAAPRPVPPPAPAAPAATAAEAPAETAPAGTVTAQDRSAGTGESPRARVAPPETRATAKSKLESRSDESSASRESTADLAEKARAGAKDESAKEASPSAAARKAEAPAAFPSTSEMRAEPQRQRLDEAKKDVAQQTPSGFASPVPPAERSARGGGAVGSLAAPPAPAPPAPASPVAEAFVPAPAPAPPVIARAPAAPQAGARPSAEAPVGALADRADKALAKSARDAGTDARSNSGDAERDKAAGGFAADASRAPVDAMRRAAPSPAPALAVSAAPSPLAPLLAAIARDPPRWSRQTGGDAPVGIDASWRDWLGELDSAAAGRWRPVADGDTRAGSDAGPGSTTLRLLLDGRLAATVRLDGATVRVDSLRGSAAERFQAALVPATADRLRTARAALPH